MKSSLKSILIIIGIVLAVAIVASLAIFLKDDSSAKDNAENKSNTKVLEYDPETVYKDIIKSYSKFLYSYGEGEILLGTPGWSSLLSMSEAYKEGDSFDKEPFEKILSELAYSYYDIDKDGAKELIIATEDEIHGIYYYDGEVKNLYLSPRNFGWGPYVTILDNGYLKYNYGHQDNQYFEYYKKESAWDKLKEVYSVSLSMGACEDYDLAYILKINNNNKVSEHCNVTFEAYEQMDNRGSYSDVRAFAIDLTSLDWKKIKG